MAEYSVHTHSNEVTQVTFSALDHIILRQRAFHGQHSCEKLLLFDKILHGFSYTSRAAVIQ